MMIRRLTAVAVLFAAVLTMGSVQAQAETVEWVRMVPKGSTLDGSLSGSITTIIVLRATGGSMQIPIGVGSIGGKWPLYDAVLIQPGSVSAAQSARIQIGILTAVSPGTRLQNAFLNQLHGCVTEDSVPTSCGSPDAAFAYWKTGMEIVQPSNSSPLLFTSNATLTGDTLGVITGQQDEDGFAEAVLTTKGQKPTFATLLTDGWLEPADRITGIIDIDYDPETGIALYGGFLEY